MRALNLAVTMCCVATGGSMAKSDMRFQMMTVLVEAPSRRTDSAVPECAL